MLEVQIGDIPYTDFIDYSFTRDMEEISSEFKLTLSTLSGGLFPVKRGDKIRAMIDNKAFITGYIDIINIDYSIDAHSIILTGRNKTQDIIDSTIDASAELKTPISLQNVIQYVLNYLGLKDIKIINKAGIVDPFLSSEIVSGQVGVGCFDFLDEYCRKRDVLLTTDGDGNIVITNGDGTLINGELIHQINGKFNNIKSASITLDDSKRFNTYIVKSQQNPTALAVTFENFLSSQAITVLRGTSSDTSIRTSRKLVLQVDNADSAANAIKRAQWEKEIRRARADIYTVTLDGFKYDNEDGDIWEPLQIVKVFDEFSSIDDELLIRKVSYNYNISKGQETILELVPKIAYNLRPVKFRKKKNNSDVPTLLLKQDE